MDARELEAASFVQCSLTQTLTIVDEQGYGLEIASSLPPKSNHSMGHLMHGGHTGMHGSRDAVMACNIGPKS